MTLIRTFPLLPLAILALLLVLPSLAYWLDDPFLVRLFTKALIFGLVAMALNLVLGFGALVSMMHASFFGIGGYVVVILAHHDFNAMPLFGAFGGTSALVLSIPLAVLATAVFAGLAGLVSLRTSGLFFIMITLAFNQMLFYFFIALQVYGGEDGLQILGRVDLFGLHAGQRVAFYYFCLTVVALVWLLLTRIIASRFGMVLRGISQNERRIRALGIEPLRYKLVAFMISAALTGLAGAIWAVNQSYISPADMAWGRSGEFVIMAVLGGIASVGGPLIGAGLFVLFEFFLSEFTTHWHLPFGLFIIFMVWVAPQGVAPLARLIGGPRHD